MQPVSHFILYIQFRTSGKTLRQHVLNHHMPIKLVGISSFADPSDATICYLQTKNRYTSSYIRKWLTRGLPRRTRLDFFYNTLVENHEEHIAAILLINACGSKRFSEHRLATSHLPCIGHWR